MSNFPNQPDDRRARADATIKCPSCNKPIEVERSIFDLSQCWITHQCRGFGVHYSGKIERLEKMFEVKYDKR